MRLPNWRKNEITQKCKRCNSPDVKRTNPFFLTLLYYPTLILFKHVHFYCFSCKQEWYDYYFKIKIKEN